MDKLLYHINKRGHGSHVDLGHELN